MRVLLTEDDPVLAGVLADFLREEGHLVTCVDMRQAGCLAHWTGWDACILDPGGDSFFELRPSAHLPVVVTTGRAWAQRADPARLGVRAILSKPFDLDELGQILETLARQA